MKLVLNNFFLSLVYCIYLVNTETSIHLFLMQIKGGGDVFFKRFWCLV